MSDILNPNARLVGLWLQLLATGAYVVHLPRCAFILRRKIREGLSLWLPAVCTVIFAITILALVCDLLLAYEANFVDTLDGRPNATFVYADVASPLSLIKNTATVALAIISDGIMVYRTFVVWDLKVIVIILPVILLLADLFLGVWSVWTLAQTRVGDEPIFAAVTVRVRFFFAVTFSVNVLCAGLICWKIWRVHSQFPREVSRMSDRPTSRVFQVIIETAALYCAHLFILIVSDCVGSNLFFLFLDPLPPITALVFTLLIVRARTPTTDDLTMVSTSIHFWSLPVGTPSVSEPRTPRIRGAGVIDTDLTRVAHSGDGEEAAKDTSSTQDGLDDIESKQYEGATRNFRMRPDTNDRDFIVNQKIKAPRVVSAVMHVKQELADSSRS
ncbi:hypothetical protein C8Q76DRAFT_617501 [Earliella scabrosa]|nr:hypothetical protein C8Q76DRAFT_617501 [Earliella scabrosa]